MGTGEDWPDRSQEGAAGCGASPGHKSSLMRSIRATAQHPEYNWPPVWRTPSRCSRCWGQVGGVTACIPGPPPPAFPSSTALLPPSPLTYPFLSPVAGPEAPGLAPVSTGAQCNIAGWVLTLRGGPPPGRFGAGPANAEHPECVIQWVFVHSAGCVTSTSGTFHLPGKQLCPHTVTPHRPAPPPRTPFRPWMNLFWTFHTHGLTPPCGTSRLVPSLSVVCSGSVRGAAGVGAWLLLAPEGHEPFAVDVHLLCVSIHLPMDIGAVSLAAVNCLEALVCPHAPIRTEVPTGFAGSYGFYCSSTDILR